MSNEYDIVLVVTAALMDDSDALTVCSYAGTTLLVVRHGKTRMKQLRELVRRFTRHGVDLTSLVLNGAPVKNGSLKTVLLSDSGYIAA